MLVVYRLFCTFKIIKNKIKIYSDKGLIFYMKNKNIYYLEMILTSTLISIQLVMLFDYFLDIYAWGRGK